MDISYLSFCPRLKLIIETNKSIDKDNNIISAVGLSTINNIKVLRELVLEKRPRITLEIGLAFGASARSNYSQLLANISLDSYVWKNILKRLINKLGYRQLEAFELVVNAPRTPKDWNLRLRPF